jgi:hypothetical protein
MDSSNKKFMWSNLRSLKMKKIPTIYTNSIRHSMGLSKLLEHDMSAFEIFSLTMILGSVKPTQLFFTRKVDKDLFLCQIYVDDIIFGSNNKKFCDKFSKIMTNTFEMSMMRELKFLIFKSSN